MATHKSAMKRIRQNEKSNLRNRMIRSKVRSFAKKVRVAVSEGNLELAQTSLKEASKQYAKAGSKGVLKNATASRCVSRLAKAVYKLQASA